MIWVLVAITTVLAVGTVLNLALTFALIRRIARMSASMGMPPGMEVGLEKGSQAPDFRAETLNGATVTLADYAQKMVSFLFISPTCAPCVEKLPAFQALAPKAQQAGVELVLVLPEEDRAATAAFVAKHKISLPVLIASTDSFIGIYKAHATPSYCTINQDGQVAASGVLGYGWEQQLSGAWTTASSTYGPAPISPAPA